MSRFASDAQKKEFGHQHHKIFSAPNPNQGISSLPGHFEKGSRRTSSKNRGAKTDSKKMKTRNGSSRTKRLVHHFVKAFTPFMTAVPFWGQSTQIPRTLSPKRDCSTKRVIRHDRQKNADRAQKKNTDRTKAGGMTVEVLSSYQHRAVSLQERFQLGPEFLGLSLVARRHVAHEGDQLGETVAVLRWLGGGSVQVASEEEMGGVGQRKHDQTVVGRA